MGEAERVTRSWILRFIGALRAAQLLPWVVVVATGRPESYVHPALVLLLFVADVGWVAAMFIKALRTGDFSARWVCADVVVTACCILEVGRWCRPGLALTWQNWTVGPMMGSTILATLFVGWRTGTAVGALLGATYALSVANDLRAAPGGTATLLGNLSALAAFSAAAGFVGARLRASARVADEATDLALRARRAEAAAHARLDERNRQYRLLHDSVLFTLTLLGRGSTELTDEIRERCRKDVEYLRALIGSVSEASPGTLNVALGQVTRDQSMMGLEIHHKSDGVANDLPDVVVTAISQAVKEALNNVIKYSGTKEAWVTATGGEDREVVVTVVDRGRGFDPSVTAPGRGTTESLRRRMAEVGGCVEIDSAPGNGTCVEIRWTA